MVKSCLLSRENSVRVRSDLPYTNTLRVVYLYMVSSGYNVNQVDGEVWNFEAAGSNPATQTNFGELDERLKSTVC